ncbi:MAG: universal stress protein [Deltaproteobacteria bacterium]|nr:universal stress protein [Deltaproteobacteria bacterium]MCB9787505.1 universal stress protein [Deltaproteobacteria bacterium]
MIRKITRILVPIDGSESSVHSAQWAVSLAESTGAAVTLLYVFPMTEAQQVSLEDLTDEERERWEGEISTESMDRVIAELPDVEVPIHRAVALGEPPAEVVRYARKDRSDLIVMGSRGTSAFTGTLIGSLSIEVLHATDIPVTIIH